MKTNNLGLISAVLIVPTAVYFAACDSEPTPTSAVTTMLMRALPDNDTFELEGDALDGVALGDDWATVLLDGGGSSIAHTGVLADPAPNSIFTGGRKDIQDISDWSHKTGSVPDKDDVTNAYAAAYEVGGELIIYFGADRFANDGDAQIGFWFFQQDVQAMANGRFSGEHVVGDLLILANFEMGGTTPEIIVLEWVGTGGDQQGGTLQMMADLSADCANTTADVCAITNSMATPSPWDYTPKGGAPGDDFPAQSFFEGGINLSALFAGQDVPCFASFMGETRSSTSVTASLKDFVLGSFEVCSIEIEKECTESAVNADETGFVHTYSVTVKNDGFGTLHNVIVTDQGETFELGTLEPGATAMFEDTFESTLNPATNSASVSAATSANGDTTLTASVGPVECPMVDLEPMISVNKSCELALDEQDGAVVLVVNFMGQVCNDTEAPTGVGLTNVSVTDDAGTPADPSDDLVIAIGDLGPGDCEPYAGSYQPTSTNSNDPSLAMFEDSVTAEGTANLGFGVVTDQASATCELCPD